MRSIFWPTSRKKFDYKSYWERRYQSGGDSGAGSFSELANFKARIINEFVAKHDVRRVIEFGCGDGNQLNLYQIDDYLGLDVSSRAIEICAERYAHDHAKSFLLYDPSHFVNSGFLVADLVICIDVLYHIIDETDFLKTLHDIFSCSSKSVILYTSTDAWKTEHTGNHVRHRDILTYLNDISEFSVDAVLKNPYPDRSSANFIYLTRK